jgi:hypothetical protein
MPDIQHKAGYHQDAPCLASERRPEEARRYVSALVHARHFVAAAGTVSRQYGHPFVGAAGAGFNIMRMMRNTTKATMTKSITVPASAP